MKSNLSRLAGALALLSMTGAASAVCWKPVPEKSDLTFEVRQADAPLKGGFGGYEASVCLDDNDPDSNSVSVSVDLATVSTGITELDEALRGGDFFAVDRWPTATFESDSVTADGQGAFTASGTLTIRGHSKPLEVPFEFEASGDGETATATATGDTRIRRLDFGVGQGEWSDTKWVGDEVEIRFDVNLAPCDGG